jgi:hypothetical protein
MNPKAEKGLHLFNNSAMQLVSHAFSLSATLGLTSGCITQWTHDVPLKA